MVDGEGKVSGEGSLFVLLLNEEASDQHSGLDGKGRLHLAWDYDGEGKRLEDLLLLLLLLSVNINLSAIWLTWRREEMTFLSLRRRFIVRFCFERIHPFSVTFVREKTTYEEFC